MDWKIALFLALIIGLTVAGAINVKVFEKAEKGEENAENMENMTGMRSSNVEISCYAHAWKESTCQRNV